MSHLIAKQDTWSAGFLGGRLAEELHLGIVCCQLKAMHVLRACHSPLAAPPLSAMVVALAVA